MPSHPPALRDEDYEAIEAAVLETARRRWFLNEYARRNRATDTHTVLEALARLERSLGGTVSQPGDFISNRVSEMGGVIKNLYDELAQLRHETEPTAHTGSELDLLISSMEQATQQILAANVDVQETSWALRELGRYTDFYDKLDRDASNIYLGCSLQDMNRQRISKIVHGLRLLEKHVAVLSGTMGVTLPGNEKENAQASTIENIIDISSEASESSQSTPWRVDHADIIDSQDNVLLEVQNAMQETLPASSFPQMQEALMSEWPGEKKAPEELQPQQASSLGLPIKIDFAHYSFEEKVALFS